MADIKLSCSAVTSSAVKLNGVKITYSLENQTGNVETINVFDESSLASIPKTGINHPQTNIQGITDDEDDRTDSIDFDLLKDFVKATSSVYIQDDVIYPNFTEVTIKDIKVTRPANQKRKKYNYTLNVIE